MKSYLLASAFFFAAVAANAATVRHESFGTPDPNLPGLPPTTSLFEAAIEAFYDAYRHGSALSLDMVAILLQIAMVVTCILLATRLAPGPEMTRGFARRYVSRTSAAKSRILATIARKPLER